ncbi:MAG TPA: 2-oxoglutarate dehydrogenase, E2 component, dihydrolipoamide succinyltransferase [Mycobacteriales bacterium]|nr:2-oxoglutarate dehydrogenase, E2 component, dihydrolipoamide succinyltransferase [Mycobacteriales bacterium]
MAVSVTMPRLGESVSEGTVTRWLKQEGDSVEADEPLLEVSTDKVDTEIPSPASGVLSSIKVQEDETVEVGVELATIDDGSGGGGDAGAEQAGGEQAQPEPEPEPEPEPQQQEPQQQEPQAQQPEPQAQQPEPEPQAQPQQEQRPEPAPQAQASQSPAPQPAAPSGGGGGGGGGGGEGAYVTPLVRKLAAEHGVDLSTVSGTGVGGRIRKQDVLDAAGQQGARQAAPEQGQQPAASVPQQSRDTADAGREQVQQPARGTAAPAPAFADQAVKAAADTTVRGTTEPMSRLRKVIAERMVESLQVSAQLTTVVEVDITRIARLRAQAKDAFAQREGVKLSFLPFFALATLEALKQHPVVNASVDQDGGTITYHDGVHLGVAVDTERGLLVPVIHEAGDLNLAGLAKKIADLAERTRTNKVTPDELGGGTFTLTNTGSRGALFDTPIINQPQVGILGTGAVVKRPVVVDDPDLGEVIAVRSMVYLALTYDHRIVDGADAARFLVTVKERLEEGDFAAELGL